MMSTSNLCVFFFFFFFFFFFLMFAGWLPCWERVSHLFLYLCYKILKIVLFCSGISFLPSIWVWILNSLFITIKRPCNIQRIFSVLKNEKFHWGKKEDDFKLFAQNIDCAYTLEPPRRVFAIYKSGVYGGILFTDMFS